MSRSALLMPAEWERHEATWISWPFNVTDWPGKFAPIPWVFAEIVRKIVAGEHVHLLVNGRDQEEKARRVLLRAGVDLRRVKFFRFPTNRAWMRDSGPVFVKQREKNAEDAIVRFRFSAWAKYHDWRKDDQIPLRAAKALKRTLFPAVLGGKEVTLEGGSIDVNGRGTLLTTEECLLHPSLQVRNPGFSRKDYEELFRSFLGATNILWLGSGIAGDDTHGHVDDLCRFVSPNTVVLCDEKNSSDANYTALRENLERLQDARLEDGSKLNVVSLPMPSPLHLDGQRLPASYANFYVCNAAVLVPTFNDTNDRIALGILAELITDRPVVGIHSVDLVWGLGALHCLTQQQPAYQSVPAKNGGQ